MDWVAANTGLIHKILGDNLVPMSLRTISYHVGIGVLLWLIFLKLWGFKKSIAAVLSLTVLEGELYCVVNWLIRGYGFPIDNTWALGIFGKWITPLVKDSLGFRMQYYLFLSIALILFIIPNKIIMTLPSLIMPGRLRVHR